MPNLDETPPSQNPKPHGQMNMLNMLDPTGISSALQTLNGIVTLLNSAVTAIAALKAWAIKNNLEKWVTDLESNTNKLIDPTSTPAQKDEAVAGLVDSIRKL